MHWVMTSRQNFCSARVKEAMLSSVSGFDYSKRDQPFATLQAYYTKVNKTFQNELVDGGRTCGDRPRQL